MCVHVCMCMCVNVCMCMCMYVCTCVYMYACVYMCMYVCMCIGCMLDTFLFPDPNMEDKRSFGSIRGAGRRGFSEIHDNVFTVSVFYKITII